MNTPWISKTRTTLASLVFVAGALAATAPAQNIHQQVRVTVPFAFQDGDTHLNPGVYTIGLENEQIMLVRSDQGSHFAYSLVTLGQSTRPTSVGKVVFHKYGDQYFLREVWARGSSTHVECLKSKAEKSLQKEVKLAATHQDPTGTEVALLQLPR